MEPVTVGIGALALVYGIFSAIMRVIKPAFFSKLKPMQEKLGNTMGNLIHSFSYIIVPLVFGIIMIIAGIKGYSFF